MAGTKGHSGGARVGGGRPKKSAAARWLQGTGTSAQDAPIAAKRAPSVPTEAPSWLNPNELAAWNELAPMALANGTLTPATAGDFAVLCSLQSDLPDLLAERRAEGWSAKGLALAKEYRGMVQRLEAKRRAYMLGAMGKPMPEAAVEVVDPFAEFDQMIVQ